MSDLNGTSDTDDSQPSPPLRFSALSLIGLLGCYGTANAQPAPPQQAAAAPIQLGTIDVVSATGVATPESQIANSVTVVTAEQMERDQRRTLPDVLATVPGLNMVQTGSPGSLAEVFIRGTNANHVKVLIDGIDVTNPSDPNQEFDLGQVLTADIARIEVLRGPQSGLYGADAIGGVISITTKKGEGPPKATATVEGGSFGTFNENANFSGSKDHFNYSFNIQHFQMASTPVTPLNLLPSGQQRINDFYDNKTYSLRMGYDFSDAFSINVVSRYTDATHRLTGDTQDPVTFASFPAASQTRQVAHQAYTRGEAVWSLFDGRFTNYFGLGYTNAWSLNEGPGFSTPGSVSSINVGERVKVDWRGVASLTEGQTLVIGVEDEQFSLEQTAHPMFRNANKAAYLELQSKFFDRLFLVSNIRRDDNDAFGGHDTYRVAPAVILPWTETKLKASYGTGFKAPTLSQLHVDFPEFNFFSNPNLKPETSIGYDYGFEQPLFNNRVRFGVTYFHNDITNLIVFGFSPPAPNQPPRGSLFNVGSSTIFGTESFVSWDVNERLSLRADYTNLRAIDDTTGLDLLRRPRIKESVTATWRPIDPLSLSATVMHVGNRFDVSRDGTVSGILATPFTLVNLAANYTISDQVSVFGRIDNLFDVHYQDPIGFERPGFGIYGGMRFVSQ
jgi:vitamin B12 transporter